MKFIPIAPIDLQSSFVRYHTFALAHMFKDVNYSEFFRYASKSTDSILDNGAYEGSSYSLDRLVKLALKYSFSELVLPDILHKSSESLALTRRAISEAKVHPLLINNSIRFMLVPQGENILKWAMSLEILCEEYVLMFGDHPFTIGIPKVTSVFSGGRMNLLAKYVIPLQEKYGFQIHLLGLGEHLKTLKTIAYVFGSKVRSIDSARPFVWAYYDIGISELYEPKKRPKRPKSYFTDVWTEQKLFLAQQNVSAYERLCLHVETA